MMESQGIKKSGVDWTLVVLVTVLVVLGIIMQYSASSYDVSLVKKQGIFAVVGFAAIFVVGRIHMRFICRLSVPVYFLALLATASTLVIGRRVKGAVRWIEFAGIRFQPSEFLKAAMIMALAAVIVKYINDINNFQGMRFRELAETVGEQGIGNYMRSLTGYILMMAVVAAAALDVAVVTKDLGTAVIIFGIGFITMWVISPSRKYLIAIAIIAAIAVLVLILAFSYRMNRITAWTDLENNTSELGYQIKQGLYAIGSGGWFGKGLGRSIQKDVIPEPHTDMIFSIVCEELGVIGGMIIILLFVLLILRLRRIYSQLTDLYGKMIVLGVTAHIALQTIVNMAVLTNLVPNTGVPLPFISYGGTSLLCLMGEIGLVMSAIRAEFEGAKLKMFESGQIRGRA